MTFDSPLLEFEVAMEPIPVTDKGKEVTVNFKTYSIENFQSFYTDQNGLGMEIRYLNYRNSYWFEPNSPHNNVSVNYYPVSSAIAIRDFGDRERRQMTVMVDRTMGGSSLE